MVEAEAGKVVIGGFKVQEEHCNLMGTLHGGVSATLVDIVRDELSCDFAFDHQILLRFLLSTRNFF